MPKSTIGRLAVAVALVALAGPARAGSVSVYNLATGFDNATQMLLAPNTTDAKYTVVGPGGTTYVPQARDASNLPSTYVGDNAMPGSRWDYVVDNAGDTGPFFSPPGNYTITTSVDLKGFKAATAQIKGLETSVDNAFLSVSVNGKTVFSQSPGSGINEQFLTVEDIGDVGPGAFQPGVNSVQFTILNQGFLGSPDSPSPEAFRFLGVVDAQPAVVPEPSGLVLTAVSIAFAACRFRLRGRNSSRSVGSTSQ
jgi:hypothetical protein